MNDTITVKELLTSAGKNIPRLEILSTSGYPEVAEIFTARTRPGDDSSLIEFVDGLDSDFPREEKWIINISTQFGCPVKCRFCDAGHRYYGNLNEGEMIAQIIYVLERHPGLARVCRKLKVHFARMGEPALNNAVLDTIENLKEYIDSQDFWVCIPTICPRGRDKWFERLYEIKENQYRGRFQLQFSINTTDEDIRRWLIPAEMNNLDWMANYANYFHKPDDRKVVLNFALAREMPFEPDEIIHRFDPVHTAIKLTPLNPTATGAENGLISILRTSSNGDILDKIGILKSSGFDIIISVGDAREDEIGSNCGQSVRKLRELQRT